MFKRARLAREPTLNAAAFDDADDPLTIEHLQEESQEGARKSCAVQNLRRYLLQIYAEGNATGFMVATIARHCTEAGLSGLEDMAVPESRSMNANAKVIHAIDNSFEPPKLEYVDVPVHDRKLGARGTFQVAVRYPTAIFDKKFQQHEEPEGAEQSPHCAVNAYLEHPAVISAQQAGLHWSRIQPLALYWDAVQFLTRESFLAFYFRDLRTNEQHLSFIVRTLLQCSTSLWD